MKRYTKLTAVILSVIMLAGIFTACFTSSAATVPSVHNYSSPANLGNEYPLIILPGINHSVSYLANEDGTPAVNADGEELSGGLLIIDTAGLVGKLVKKLLWPLISSLFMQFDNGLSDAAYDVVCDLFAIQSCDKEGNQTHNLKTDSYNYPVSQMEQGTRDWLYRMLPMKSIANEIGEDNIYLYTFPLIGDPMDSARGLVDYIEMVKQQKGVDKVNIAAVSLGGTILTSYANIVNGDWSNVNQIINVVSLLNGTDLIADFYAREWNLSDEYLYRDYIRNIIKESNGTETLGCIINGALRLFSRKTVENLLTRAFDGMLDTMLINNPQFWAMVPAERYEALADRYLSGEEYAVLRAKTDAFQQARVNLRSNLIAANNSGVAINNICGYNLSFNDGSYCFFGIAASSATTNSDGIIPVYSTSLGATTVAAGNSFGEDYLANADEKYISPDGSVDASTCLFPDNVWFFNGQHHETGYDDVVFSLLGSIINGSVTDVDSSASYPQFNGFRKTERITRHYIPDAKVVMANVEGKYTAEQVDAVAEAYSDAMALLADTVLDENAQAQADAVADKLEDALVATGIRVKSEPKASSADLFGEKIITTGDDIVFKIFRGAGYTDFRIGNLFK